MRSTEFCSPEELLASRVRERAPTRLDVARGDLPGPRLRALRDLSGDALRLAASIGEAWKHAAPERRKAFLEEWFSEMRLHGDGRIDLVAREAVREIVFAAAPPPKVGMVGNAGLEPATFSL